MSQSQTISSMGFEKISSISTYCICCILHIYPLNHFTDFILFFISVENCEKVEDREINFATSSVFIKMTDSPLLYSDLSAQN